MAYWRRFLYKLRNFVRPGPAELELTREIETHLALLRDDFERRGMSVEEARLAAKREYGGVEQTKELHREMRSWLWLDQVRRDIRFSIRTLWNTPVFSITAISTLALGIGANTAVFSEKATVTEWLTLDGDIMTVTTYLDDPVYMEEPHLQSISFRRNLHQELPFFPCTIGVENVAEGFPHFLPGKNPYVADAAKKLGLPLEAVKGGKATIYPEYRQRLKELMK